MPQPYGIIDTADLKLTACDFEKDANAMVLFDQGIVTYDITSVVMKRHKRIKIFNDEGKNEANVRIQYYGVHRNEEINNLQAETINLNGDKIEYTSIETKLFYTQKEDKSTKAITFTFPNVKAGSVIEFEYTWSTPYSYNYPDWAFQTTIPTRYSEFDASFDHSYIMQFTRRVYQPVFKDTVINIDKEHSRDLRHIWALTNIKSYHTEPYMDYPLDYLQSVLIKPFNLVRTWKTIGEGMLEDEDMGRQLGKTFPDQTAIIAKANAFKTNDEKIAYLFDTVKKVMKWNKENYWFTVDGVKKAWNKKTGNSTEINLILFNLLKSCNIKPNLIALYTKDEGRLDPRYASWSTINKIVVYIQVDSTKNYLLDASNPYNVYNKIPFDLIGLNVLSLDPVSKKTELIKLWTGEVKETTLTTGTIGADGKLAGTTQIMGSTYSREKYLTKYKELGEKKYIQEVEKKNQGLKILSLKLDNMDADTLPLIQNFELKYDGTEPDGDYLYFNPTQLTNFEANPFTSESRVSNIDFNCLYSYSINGRYTIPAGYKIDVLPKLVTMSTNDKSILFKRLIGEQDGNLVVHYLIDFKRSRFDKDEYKGLREFYNKMYDMLNEQIVLKKQ